MAGGLTLLTSHLRYSTYKSEITLCSLNKRPLFSFEICLAALRYKLEIEDNYKLKKLWGHDR